MVADVFILDMTSINDLNRLVLISGDSCNLILIKSNGCITMVVENPATSPDIISTCLLLNIVPLLACSISIIRVF